MSTSPEPASASAAENAIVSALSRWLASHLGNADLRARLETIGTDSLGPDQRQAVEELLGELDSAREGERGELEMLVRETLETVVLGG